MMTALTMILVLMMTMMMMIMMMAHDDAYLTVWKMRKTGDSGIGIAASMASYDVCGGGIGGQSRQRQWRLPLLPRGQGLTSSTSDAHHEMYCHYYLKPLM